VGIQNGVVDNREAKRFELAVDGEVAFIRYFMRDGRVVMRHTEVPPRLRGRGIGTILIRGALEIARDRRIEVVPRCPFVIAFLRDHPDYLDLIPENEQQQLELRRA
jgi:predicted GNAT family acetyltransferase